MEEYIPISTPKALAEKLGLRPDQILKLDGNENPYGCSPRVPSVLAEFASYHRYPDPEQTETRAMLSQYVGVPADNLMPVSYTHLRAHETRHDLVCRLL